MLTVTDIRERLIDNYNLNKFVIDKSGVKMVEIVGASFLANEDNIFGQVNEDYVRRELDWYLSQSLNVNDIPGETPKIWKQVATPEGLINSNYGYLVYSEENGSQYERVLAELISAPTSRRAVMIYTRPSIWNEYNKDGMSDFICTNAVQYLIRDNKLEVVVQMRSNDAWAGYRNDLAWQKYVQNELVDDINSFDKSRVDNFIKPGNIYWNAGSLHVYERDFWRIECWHLFGENLTKKDFEERMFALNNNRYED
jgi:thymidylate synthase